MIAGVVASNQRVLPFFTTATNINISGSSSNGTPSSLEYLNGEYVLLDSVQKDVMTSSSMLTGYTDVVTSDNTVGAGGWVTYENGRYFIYENGTSAMDTATTLGGVFTAVSIGDLGWFSPIRWFGPNSAWWAAGDDGNAQTGGGCLLRYSTNGTTWTTVATAQEPSTLRLLGLATDGTKLIVASEGTSTVAHIMKYTTSTNPASLTWTTITSPFANNQDIGAIYYDSVKSTWTCSSANSVFAYSTDGTTWTAKDIGFAANAFIRVVWVPWQNRWVATQLRGERQFAYSNTSDIGGTWTMGTQTTSTAAPKGFLTLTVDPKNRYIVASGTTSTNGHAVWSL